MKVENFSSRKKEKNLLNSYFRAYHSVKEQKISRKHRRVQLGKKNFFFFPVGEEKNRQKKIIKSPF
jgi:hypothetical protein